MSDRVKPSFVILTSWHSYAQGKWRLNPVWHRMLYSCTLSIRQQWTSKG